MAENAIETSRVAQVIASQISGLQRTPESDPPIRMTERVRWSCCGRRGLAEDHLPLHPLLLLSTKACTSNAQERDSYDYESPCTEHTTRFHRWSLVMGVLRDTERLFSGIGCYDPLALNDAGVTTVVPLPPNG